MTYKADTRKPASEGDPATRECLVCRKGFSSEWKGNRVCTNCKNTTAWKSGGEYRKAPQPW